MTTPNEAYYAGRTSISDDGSELYGPTGFPGIVTDVLKANFRQGQRDMRSELRLSADTEWDRDSA